MKKKILILAVMLGAASCDQRHADPTVKSQADGGHGALSGFYAARPTQYDWPDANPGTSVDANLLLDKNYYLVIDGSGSMDDVSCSDGLKKIDAAKKAVSSFIESIPEGANVGLLAFDDAGITERVSLGKDRRIVQKKVSEIVANGGTPLKEAIELAYESVKAQGRNQLGYGEYHIVVVTDGEANSGQDPTDIVTRVVNESPVEIHTVGFCIGNGHSLNSPGITTYSSASDPEELLAGLKNVLAESESYPDTFDGAK